MNLFGELRYGVRTWLRQPTLFLIALATLTLGIGASTAVFTLVKAVLLDQLPYPDPGHLVVIKEVDPQGEENPVSTPTFLDWLNDARSFEGLAGYRHVRYTFSAEEPLDVPSLRATPGLFSLLGVEPFMGGAFPPQAATPGNDRIAILSYAFWSQYFGQDPDVVGRNIELDTTPHTVVGVMPESFDFPPGSNVRLWTALSFDPNDGHGRSRRARSLNVVARIDRDANLDQARAEIAGIGRSLAEEYPATMNGWGTALRPAHEELVENVRPALLFLMGAVGFLLLIACVNIANLLLARLSSRRREMALRAALGASRWALARQALAESFVLAVPGAIGGLLLTFVAIRVARSLPAGVLPRIDQVGVDPGVLLFTLATTLLVSVAFGVLPALDASRPDLRDSLAETAGAGARPTTQRLLSTLVVVEVALALVLLSAAGTATSSFNRLMSVDPGFEPERLLAAQVYLPQPRYPQREDRLRFFTQAIERLRQLPGVQSVAAVSSLPMHPVGIDYDLPFSIEGRDLGALEPRADLRAATPGYFETMRVSLLDGRVIDAGDHSDAPPTMLINETLARRFFSDQDPLGGVINTPHGSGEIIGVVSDMRHHGLDREPRPEIYLPFEQQAFPGMSIVVRTSQNPENLAGPLRHEIWGVDSDQPIYDLSTMEQAISRWVFLPRLSTRLLGAFAVGALILAVVGIYGVISYSVTQRKAELGVRVALGAAAKDLVAMVVGRSMTLVGLGMGFGLAGSLAVTRLLSGQLYAIEPLEPGTLAIVCSILLVVALIASFLPARRAGKVDPIRALRLE